DGIRSHRSQSQAPGGAGEDECDPGHYRDRGPHDQVVAGQQRTEHRDAGQELEPEGREEESLRGAEAGSASEGLHQVQACQAQHEKVESEPDDDHVAAQAGDDRREGPPQDRSRHHGHRHPSQWGSESIRGDQSDQCARQDQALESDVDDAGALMQDPSHGREDDDRRQQYRRGEDSVYQGHVLVLSNGRTATIMIVPSMIRTMSSGTSMNNCTVGPAAESDPSTSADGTTAIGLSRARRAMAMPLNPRLAPPPSTNRCRVPVVNTPPARPPISPEITIDQLTTFAVSMPWARANLGLAPVIRSSEPGTVGRSHHWAMATTAPATRTPMVSCVPGTSTGSTGWGAITAGWASPVPTAVKKPDRRR